MNNLRFKRKQKSRVENLVSTLTRLMTRASSNGMVCNYQDNYYGDQMCVTDK